MLDRKGRRSFACFEFSYTPLLTALLYVTLRGERDGRWELGGIKKKKKGGSRYKALPLLPPFSKDCMKLGIAEERRGGIGERRQGGKGERNNRIPLFSVLWVPCPRGVHVNSNLYFLKQWLGFRGSFNRTGLIIYSSTFNPDEMKKMHL